MRRISALAVLLLVLAAPAAADAARDWAPADKDGFATSHTLRSKVWLTLGDGGMTEVYYPRLDTPAARDLRFVVSDGKTFTDREQDATRQRVELLDSRSLSYRQVNTDRDGLYRIVKTYTTDPARSTVLVHVRFEARTHRRLHLTAVLRPGALERRRRRPRRERAATRWSPGTRRRRPRSCPRAAPSRPTTAASTAPGDVVQSAELPLDGRHRARADAGARVRRRPRRRAEHRARLAAARLRRRRPTRTSPAGTATSARSRRARAAPRGSAPRTGCRRWSWPRARTRPSAAPASPRRACPGPGAC